MQYGEGALKELFCHKPCLQKFQISLKGYSSVLTSGFNMVGSVDAGGRISWFFSSTLDCSGEVLNSLK